MVEKPQGFWASIPGILTGLAAVITAITGLYIAINSNSLSLKHDVDKADVIEMPVKPTVKKILVKEEPTNRQQDTSQSRANLNPVTPVIPTVSLVYPVEKVNRQIHEYEPFPETGELVECSVFPTENTVTSLMSWSDYYHQQIIAAKGENKRAMHPCDKTIEYRSMAHCKAPSDLEIRQALLETLVLCRVAGIEWLDGLHRSTMSKIRNIRP